MKFSLPILVFAFGLLASANPYPEAFPEALAEADTDFVEPDADLSTEAANVTPNPQNGCKKGKYRCVGLSSGCKKCAIAVGIGANTCKLNNVCGGTNSCQVANGQPYCV
ncbi:MAG: hypothetical protein M1820_002534 [Bogoriella megaspora]|nr:MAG: hypothetical protein M1820_002534 [Bogoriella megaspora]